MFTDCDEYRSFPAEWQMPPSDLRLMDDEVHVWGAYLDQPASFVSRMLRNLSADERTRAERFRLPQDRHRYIIAHGILRALLAQYLNVEPADLPLHSLPHGKPVLAPAPSGNQIQFNLSHSHELALYAIGRGRQLGIDIEWTRAQPLAEEVAESFFSPREVAALRALPQSRRSDAFFACWTQKEAYTKARGEGLRKPLDQFAVVVASDQPAALLYDGADSQAVSRWSLQSLDVGPDYAASLAVEGNGWQLRCWRWTGARLPQCHPRPLLAAGR